MSGPIADMDIFSVVHGKYGEIYGLSGKRDGSGNKKFEVGARVYGVAGKRRQEAGMAAMEKIAMRSALTEKAASSLERMNIFMDTQVRVPSFAMPYQHRHTFVEFYFLRKGRCVYTVGDGYMPLQEGNIVLVRPGERHSSSYAGRENAERVVIFFKQEMVGPFLRMVPGMEALLAETTKIVLDKESIRTLEDILKKIAREQIMPGAVSLYAQQQYMMEILILLLNRGTVIHDAFVPAGEMEPDIQRALAYIGQEFAAPLTLESAAECAGLNPAYFSRKFHAITGVTFKEYLNGVRLKSAM